MSDSVVAHSDGWSVPAHSDAGGAGVQHFQVCGSIRDWKGKKNGDRKKLTTCKNRVINSRKLKFESEYILVLCFPLSGRLSFVPLTA